MVPFLDRAEISKILIKLIKTRKEVYFGKPKLVYPCSYNYKIKKYKK